MVAKSGPLQNSLLAVSQLVVAFGGLTTASLERGASCITPPLAKQHAFDTYVQLHGQAKPIPPSTTVTGSKAGDIAFTCLGLLIALVQELESISPSSLPTTY